MDIYDEIRIEIEMDQKMCSDCKKSSSEYYELLLQIRFAFFNEYDIIKEKVINILDNERKGINRFEEIDNGFDIYYRNHSHMNKIYDLFSKRFLVDEARSKKLIGRDNLVSKDKYRYFQRITIINLKRKDMIKVKGEHYIINNIQNNDLVLQNINTGEKRNFKYSIIKEYIVLE